MKQIIIFILTIMFLNSCSTNKKIQKNINQDNQQLKIEQKNDTIPEIAFWAEDFISDYLEKNSERLTKIDDYPISYIKNITTRNGRKYVMVNIGHNFEHRFVTEQFIYIDNLTKTIYEYNVQNDSLVLWKK